eukprot:2712064-Prymnesium_polylepis.1
MACPRPHARTASSGERQAGWPEGARRDCALEGDLVLADYTLRGGSLDSTCKVLAFLGISLARSPG